MGFDSSDPLLAALRKGELHGLTVQNPFRMGYLGVKTAIDALAGRPYRADHPADARRRGVAMIHQELPLAPRLTVAENVTLGLERTRFGFL